MGEVMHPLPALFDGAAVHHLAAQFDGWAARQCRWDYRSSGKVERPFFRPRFGILGMAGLDTQRLYRPSI